MSHILLLFLFSLLLYLIMKPELPVSEHLLECVVIHIDNSVIYMKSLQVDHKIFEGYVMKETVYSKQDLQQLTVGDLVVIEHTGQIMESSVTQIYLKRIWQIKKPVQLIR